MQHSNCMRNNTFSSVACLAVQYYSTLSRMRQIFEKKKLLNINLCFNFLLKILPKKILPYMYILIHARCRYSCQILIKLDFFRHVFEK